MNKQQKLSLAGIILGCVFSLSPMVGLLGTVIGMNRTFAELGSTGVSNPKQLADSIGDILISSAAGIAFFPLGMLILVVSIVFFVRSSKVNERTLSKSVAQ